MNYQNVISAVVRALAAETINSAGGCNVEPRVQTSKLNGEITGKDAALLADCIVHKLLHAQLAPVTDDLTAATVEECGHVVPLEQPEAMAELLVRHLAPRTAGQRS